ncbi:MAG: hypothetical protein Q9184_004970 [Pyrenodesmia sp. 2 TL-2023]
MGLQRWVHYGNEQLDKISKTELILGICIVLPLSMIIVAGMRLYVRMIILKSFGNDDWSIYFSALCGAIYAALCIGQTVWGLGLPVELRPPEDIDQYSKINFAGRPFYMLGILGFKVSLCLAYLRILHGSGNRLYKIIIKTIMGGAIVTHLAGTLILLFQCRPVHKSWIKNTEGTCMPDDKTFYGLASVSIFFDVVIFPLPIPALVRLNISKAKKKVLIALFGLGAFTTACSAMRMYQISVNEKTGNATMLVVWGVIELNVGIILTCIPTLGPLFPGLVGGSSNRPSSRTRLQVLRPRAGNPATPTQYNFAGDFPYNPPAPVTLNGTSSAEEFMGLTNAGAATTPPNNGQILMTTEIDITVHDLEPGTPSKRGTAYTAPW